MRVRKRKQRKEGEGHPATSAATAMDPDPVVILVVSLLKAPAMTNDRIPFTKRAPAYDDLVAVFRPVGGKLVRRDGNWDEVDRTSQGFLLCLRPAKIIDRSGTRLLKRIQLKENIAPYTKPSWWDLRILAVYDCVGFVKAVFTALGRKNCVRRRRCGEAGVKGAFFAFISTLDTGLPTSTIGLGSNVRFFLRFDP